MKSKIMYFILIISLAFNLAFMGMFIWRKVNDPHRNIRRNFHKMRKNMQPEMEELKILRDEFKLERDKFMDYLRSDDFEIAKADSILHIMLEKQMEMEKRFGSKLIELRKKGTIPDFPEPPEGMGPEGSGPHHRNMFDKDNDHKNMNSDDINRKGGGRNQDGMDSNGKGQQGRGPEGKNSDGNGQRGRGKHGRNRGEMEQSNERREK